MNHDAGPVAPGTLAAQQPFPGCTAPGLRRLRHTVGTVLVADGKILKAAGRLRHRDPSTTLRNYAVALPLDDQDVADTLDQLYRPDTEPDY